MCWKWRPKPSCAIGGWPNPGFCMNSTGGPGRDCEPLSEGSQWRRRRDAVFLDCRANKVGKEAKKTKSAKEAKREWGMRMGKYTFSPAPTSYSPLLFANPLYSVA